MGVALTTATVLHVVEALGAGVSRHIVDLVTFAEGYRHVVVVPSERHGDVTDVTAVPALLAVGADVRTVEMRRQPAHPDNARALPAIRRIIAEVDPDVVHGHSHVGGALARLAGLGRQRRPSVWTPHGMHTSRQVVLAERALGRLTAMTVAVSDSEAALLRTLNVARSTRLTVIPNGIDLSRPAKPTGTLREELGVSLSAPLIGTVGRLLPQKAPVSFVEVARLVALQVPDACFVQIGAGPLAGEVDERAAELTAANRYFRVPYLPEAAAYLGDLDAFVLLSNFEGGPYAPLEAMRGHVPVVLSDVVGNRDAVEAGVSGLLVPLGDPKAGAEAVLRLLADPELRAAIVTAADARLKEHFDARTMGARHADLYDRLCGRSGRR